MSQKEYILAFIEAGIHRVKCWKNNNRPRLRNVVSGTYNTSRSKKRARVSKTNPELSSKRLDRPLALHQRILFSQLRRCAYCVFEKARAALNDEAQIKPRRSTRGCSYCDVHLCHDHFDKYHE